MKCIINPVISIPTLAFAQEEKEYLLISDLNHTDMNNPPRVNPRKSEQYMETVSIHLGIACNIAQRLTMIKQNVRM